jgi:hypothetical protein
LAKKKPPVKGAELFIFSDWFRALPIEVQQDIMLRARALAKPIEPDPYANVPTS